MNISKNRFFANLKEIVNLSGHIDVNAAAISIRNNIRFSGPNVFILFCAVIIASIGLNVNSVPVIIGAMLVSPLMGPIIGLGLSLGTNDTTLLKDSLKNLAVMVCISIIASSLYFLLSPLRLGNPTELLARTNPTIYDVLIALFGGFAGILETTRKDKGTVLSGVAIATALMPPLCTIGYGVSQLNLHYIAGAFYLFFINSVFIALATFIATKYLQFPMVELADPIKQKRRSRFITILIIIIIVPSVITAMYMVRQNNFTRSADKFITANKSIGKSYIYDYEVHATAKPPQVELFLAGEPLKGTEQELLFVSAEKYGISRNQLVLRAEATRSGDILSEKELVKGIMENNEQKLKQRDDTIAALRTFLKKQVPTTQLASEIASQYPSVHNVTIAQGDNVSVDGNDKQSNIVVIVYTKSPLGQANLVKLKKWLMVRLQADNVEVLEL